MFIVSYIALGGIHLIYFPSKTYAVVLIRSALASHFEWVPTPYNSMEKQEKCQYFSAKRKAYLELCNIWCCKVTVIKKKKIFCFPDVSNKWWLRAKSTGLDQRAIKAYFTYTGVILEGDLGEKVSLSWLTSPYLEPREKWKCIECIRKSKILTKTSPWNPEIVTKLLPLWKL